MSLMEARIDLANQLFNWSLNSAIENHQLIIKTGIENHQGRH